MHTHTCIVTYNIQDYASLLLILLLRTTLFLCLSLLSLSIFSFTLPSVLCRGLLGLYCEKSVQTTLLLSSEHLGELCSTRTYSVLAEILYQINLIPR